MARREREEERTHYAPERAGINGGVMGGIIMLVIAAVWFFLGLKAGYIFYYPPVLALIGVYAIVKGMSEGNYTGTSSSQRRTARRGEARDRRPDTESRETRSPGQAPQRRRRR